MTPQQEIIGVPLCIKTLKYFSINCLGNNNWKDKGNVVNKDTDQTASGNWEQVVVSQIDTGVDGATACPDDN